VKHVFGALRFVSKHFRDSLQAALTVPWFREALLAVPISIGSRRMPLSGARRAVDDLRASTAFEATFLATRTPFSGRDIAVPVTVAFGDRDWILPKRSRRRDGVPPHTRWLEQPGWGHVPMWRDSAGVANLILEGTD
jgi:pimeloyl-ACP methyl ester carboxylesterase